MKIKNKFNKILVSTFVLYISVFFVLFVIIKDKDFSELENRKLSKFPKFTLERLMNKEFGDEFETYLADQFPLRDKFISIKSSSEYVLQKKENNGVYIGDNGMFIEKFDEMDTELIDKITSYINNFSKKYNTYMMIAPTTYTIYSDNLPMYVDTNKELDAMKYFISKLDSEIVNIPIVDILKEHKKEYIYYNTDHHWTTLGAYYGYTKFAEYCNIDAMKYSEFDKKVVSDSFYGTLFSKGNFTYAKPDSISLYYPKKEIDYVVDYVFSEKQTNSLYELEYLDVKDKYGVFLDNNHPLVKISTNIKNGKKIAIIKDSYSHSLIPFLVNNFEEIHVIDLRMFKGNVDNYLMENGLEDILFMYNVRNIISDRNIMRLK